MWSRDSWGDQTPEENGRRGGGGEKDLPCRRNSWEPHIRQDSWLEGKGEQVGKECPCEEKIISGSEVEEGAWITCTEESNPWNWLGDQWTPAKSRREKTSELWSPTPEIVTPQLCGVEGVPEASECLKKLPERTEFERESEKTSPNSLGSPTIEWALESSEGAGVQLQEGPGVRDQQPIVQVMKDPNTWLTERGYNYRN